MMAYERDDSCYGTIIGRCKAGGFLVLDNGEEAFGYDLGNLPLGSQVICNIRRAGTEARRILVRLESVIQYGSQAA